jgi:hypothetical protein
VRPRPISGVLAVAPLLSGCGGGGSSYSPPVTYSVCDCGVEWLELCGDGQDAAEVGDVSGRQWQRAARKRCGDERHG